MSTIDEIKERLDIAEVVSQYVPLQKSGRNFKARCPFHTEKTPSFFVFPERGTWHCFGSCATGGDVFSFVMKKEGIDFSEALRLLAERAGVALPSRKRERSEEARAERLYGAMEAAALFYHRTLREAASAEAARRHLAHRGISADTIERFQLGYSPDARDALRAHLAERGYSPDELTAAGLIVAREDGGWRDMFRNRLMIPIASEKGRVIGFGARALGDGTPKYMNSPQSALFDKSGSLFGLDRAREAIREQGLVIIVEGYMDALIAHQYGFANVVASMGTSLTRRHVDLVKRLTRNIALALDADAAGDEATLRGLEVARHALSEPVAAAERDFLGDTSKVKGSLKVICLPRGKDPDEVIREDPQQWQALVGGAVPVMDYLFQAAIAAVDLSHEAGKSQAVAELLPLISKIDDWVERELYLKRLSHLVGVDEKTLAGELARRRATARERPTPRAKRAEATVAARALRHPVEEYCLSLLLQNPELGESGEAIPPEHFLGTENRELYLAWRGCRDINELRSTVDEGLHEHLDRLASRELPPSDGKGLKAAFAECTRRLEEQRLRRLMAIEEVLITEAESEGKAEEVQALLERALGPTTKLRDLFHEGRKGQKGADR